MPVRLEGIPPLVSTSDSELVSMSDWAVVSQRSSNRRLARQRWRSQSLRLEGCASSGLPYCRVRCPLSTLVVVSVIVVGFRNPILTELTPMNWSL